ncbi:helix-turn-helix domain-containing protein [Mycobacteroides abscessus subsp. abscessus]|nr:helix-turn-helix domain-containing protein [Mycobacteroides abscessus subsp. abscessus]
MGEVSPVAYARRCRLQAVRNTLQAAQRSQRDLSVTQVALDHGFSHMGRFAAQYRAAFGLSPSDERADMTRDSTRA